MMRAYSWLHRNSDKKFVKITLILLFSENLIIRYLGQGGYRSVLQIGDFDRYLIQRIQFFNQCEMFRLMC